MKSLNSMNRIYDNEVNNIAKFNLQYDIQKSSKRNKDMYIDCPPILHGCMNTRKSKTKFNNSRNLLNSGFSSTIMMRILITKLDLKKDAGMQ